MFYLKYLNINFKDLNINFKDLNCFINRLKSYIKGLKLILNMGSLYPIYWIIYDSWFVGKK
jgi:hypothetical protein